MEVDLKDIIEKIKLEGVDEARKQAREIVVSAEAEAKEIVAGGRKQSEALIAAAKAEAAKLKANSEEAMRQASRNVLLGLRQNIVALFDRVVKMKVAEALSPEVLKEMIVRLVEKFNESGKTEVEVLLSEEDKNELEKTLFSALKNELAGGVTLKASAAMEHGFRIGEKNANAYYDFTDDAIEEAFKGYLNRRLSDILTPGTTNER
jgi:V/A-type H+/Na+-transporting ATPase subunit E